MTDVTLIALPREAVLASLGPAWPAAPDAALVRIDQAAGVTDGAVVVYETPGQPGVTWWLVDGVIPPQGAGLGGEPLAALIPGATVDEPQPPAPDTPPYGSTWGVDSDVPFPAPARAEPRHQEGH
ncbi:hypothetical protein [Streptomyces sp. IBSNAI001]|uniref:hypothetical protein n=1 Tax=Streptomyces sp. IBSNAI001 TaxID=3457499 RepID=UPI003FCF2755